MAQNLSGNTRSLPPSLLKRIQRLYSRVIGPHEIISRSVASELCELANESGRRIALLVSREGKIEEVIVGTREIVYLPDLGRYRFGRGRLRRLRLIFSDLSKSAMAEIPGDIFADLEKLRLDAVVSVKSAENAIRVAYAHLRPLEDIAQAPIQVESVNELSNLNIEFDEFMNELESQLSSEQIEKVSGGRTGAVLVGVYPKHELNYEQHISELRELANTANIQILAEVVQRRTPDPKTILGKGKLEQTVLQCLRLGAELIIFDTELKPFQWRVITNSTELKVIDRSMLILDIFAQRAQSSAGRLQVELAQLKYNLPRLVEKDAGLSRLTGGIGGRGPGETKLEIGRRRSRERIRILEQKIEKLGQQRGVQQSSRVRAGVPLVAIIGYTNAGKSTLFNKLSKSSVLVENKLFATLDTTRRKIVLNTEINDNPEESYSEDTSVNYGLPIVLSDTVGFIRDLPAELKAAFSATLEELNEATILLHVLDCSDPNIEEQKKAVEAILGDMNLLGLPRIIVLNKSDKQSADVLSAQIKEYSAIATSAIKGQGLPELLNAIRGMLAEEQAAIIPACSH